MKKTLMLPLAALALVSCGGDNNVNFTEAEAYFVRNDVEQVPCFISSEAERDSTLGMATTMTSRPTEIDFDTEVAVPVALPETNVPTEVAIKSVSVSGDELVVTCDVKRADKEASYSMKPFAMAIVKKADIEGVKAVRVVEE